VRYSLENPHIYAQTNYVGTLNIFELARDHGSPQVVYASSSSIYGMRSTVPFKENARSEEPVSMYAATKLASELLARAYVHLYDMHITSIRPFTVYGPWGRPDMAPIIFAKAITTGSPLPLHNGGDMSRDFSYIDDVVDGFVRAFKSPKGYTVYNIGRGSPMPLLDFIRALEGEFGKKANIDNKPMQPGDVYQTYADITQAKKDLGYNPKVNVAEGVAAFADWYRDYYKV
jgi:UDP-glucuronate 4-epimerase